MTRPDGTVSTGSDYMINGKVSIGQVIAYTGYGLNEKYEMQEGEWTFQIWYQDKKMIDHTFITYWPDESEIQKLGNLSPPTGNLTVSASEPLVVDAMTSGAEPVNKDVPMAAERRWLN